MSRENEERSFLEERRLGRELMFNDPNDKVPDTSSIRPAHVDQPIAPTQPLKAPQKASQKAWSPSPVDMGALMGREPFAMTVPFPMREPDPVPEPGPEPDPVPEPVPELATDHFPTIDAAPCEEPRAQVANPQGTATHPSGIQTHLSSHASFITSDRQIGLKLLSRPVLVTAPGTVVDYRHESDVGASPTALHANAGSPVTLAGQLSAPAEARTVVHSDSAATLPQMDIPGISIHAAPTVPAEMSRAEARLEARDTGVIWVPATGVAQVIDHDPNAGRTTPQSAAGLHEPGLFAQAPSGDPTNVDPGPEVILAAQPVRRNLDWRVGAIGALVIGYLPVVLGDLLNLHPTNITGFGVLAILLAPVVFIVTSARRQATNVDTSRNKDLVIGGILTVSALLIGRLAPAFTMGSTSLWRPDLVALPVAVAAVMVLLWGTAFAADLRNVVAVTALGAPLFSVALLTGSRFPFGGGVNPLGSTLAGFFDTISRTDKDGIFSVGTTDAVTVDLRALNERRGLIVAVFVVAIVMVVLARVDPSRNNAAQISPVGRTARKLGGLLLTLLTAVAVDTLLSAVGLVGPVLAPAGVTSVITSFPATVVLYLIATWSVTRWVHLLGLHIPSLAGIRRAPMQLPKHGPRSTLDRIAVITSIGFLAISALLSGLAPDGPIGGASTVNAPTLSDSLVTPAGWTVAQTTNQQGLEAYFGARSTWTRFELTPNPNSPLAQVHVDIVRARRPLLTKFAISGTYRSGAFRLLRTRNVDLGQGAHGHQVTFYDSTTSSTWSTVTFLARTGGTARKITISATGTTDTGIAPTPGAQAIPSMVTRPGRVGADKVLAQGRIDRTENAVADLARAEVMAIRGGLVA